MPSIQSTRKKVFLSSTSIDLEDSRAAVISHLAQLDNYQVIAMENFGARDASPLDHCLAMVESCDIFIALVGHRHGSCPPSSLKSFSELEYDQAVAKGIPRIVFLYSGQIDVGQLEPDNKRSLQQGFRERIRKDRLAGGFGSKEEIPALVSAALSNLEFWAREELSPRTVLLFPFVSSVPGFNTGLAISNVGAWPGELTLYSGIIAFYFYGTLTGGGGGPLVSVQRTSRAIAAGQVATMSLLFGGPDCGLWPLVGFQGFVYASCEFPNARGYCRISDPSNLQTATGYLAEILAPSFKMGVSQDED